MAQEPAKKVDDQDFDAAFSQAALEGEKDVQGKTVVEETPKAKTPEEEAAAKKVEEEAAAVAVTTKAAQEKQAQEDAAKAEANKGKTAEQIEAETKATDEKLATEKAEAARVKQEAEAKAAQQRSADEAVARDAAVKAATERKVKDDAARKTFEESISPYEPTAEEKAAMEDFKKNFPTEHAAMESRLKAEKRVVNRQVYDAVQAAMTRVYADFTPLAQGYAADSEAAHFEKLRAAHTDYDTVVDLVPAWIKKQPAYLQTAYQSAYDGGSTQEVIDLVTRFKTDTGRVTPAVTTTAVVTPEPARKGATKEEIESGLPVNTRRAAPNTKGAPDANDYDGAFDEAAKAK